MKVVNGHIISGTSICVDYWLWTPGEKYHHFLTHLHADHTVNLKSTFCEKIYTSSFNAWLLRRWFNISPEFIVPLHVGDSHIIYDETSQTRFSVTLLDANHCPGSVMFLFQGEFGNILYTGDFRYHPKILEHPMLKSLIENEALDRLYLDNTFAAEHCEFPPRQEALKDVINVIKDHPDHSILVGVRKLGKEEVLRAIALELKEKVCVSDEKLRILTKLGYETVFTVNPEDSRILVKEMHHITARSIDQLRTERGPVATILLTALYSVIPPDIKYSSISADTDKGIHKIPYSDHSCHSELLEFVSKIKPKEIFPIVSSTGNNFNSSQRDGVPEILSCCWLNSVIPKSILKFTLEPKNQEVVIPVMKNSSISCLKENVVSYMTEDDSETSSENTGAIRKSSQVVKARVQQAGKDWIGKSDEDEVGRRNESPETIPERNHSPSLLGSHREDHCICQQTIYSDNERINQDLLTKHSAEEASEEYFTVSDEDLSQVGDAEPQNHIASIPNLTTKELEKEDYVNLDSIEIAHANNVGVQSQQLCTHLTVINSKRHSPGNQPYKRKKVNFTPSTPEFQCKPTFSKKRLPTPMPKTKQSNLEEMDVEDESVGLTVINSKRHSPGNQPYKRKKVNLTPSTPVFRCKHTFFKKRLPTPMPKTKQSNIEVDIENERIGNGKSGAWSDKSDEEGKLSHLMLTESENVVTRNLSSHLTNGSDCNITNLTNLEKIEDLQNLNVSTPLLQNNSKSLNKHPLTLVSEKTYSDMNREDEGIKIMIRSEKSLTASKENTERSVVSNYVNASKTHLNGQCLIEIPSCDTMSIVENRSQKCHVGKNVMFPLNTLREQKTEIYKNDGLALVPTKIHISEGNLDDENNSLTIPKTNILEDEYVILKCKGNSNTPVEEINILPNFTDNQNQLKNNFINKQVTCNKKFLSSKETVVDKNVSIPMAETTNKSGSNKRMTAVKQTNEDENFRLSILQSIFQSTSPITNENVTNDDRANDCVFHPPTSIPTPAKPQYQPSWSDMEISVPLPKSQRKEYDDGQSANSGSDSTISDLECSGLTLGMLEILDKRNDQVCKSSQTNPSTSKPCRVSEKFKHLLVTKNTQNSTGSGFFSPVSKANPKPSYYDSDSRGSLLLQSKKLLTNRNNCRNCREIEIQRPGVEKQKSFQRNVQTSRRIPKLAENKRLNELHKCDDFCRHFLENPNDIYKSWKESVELQKLRNSKMNRPKKGEFE